MCNKFLGKGKHDISASEMFVIYETMRDTSAAMDKILEQELNNPDIALDSEFIQAKTTVQLALEEAKTQTTRVIEYCIQDSELILELIETLNVWVGLVEMSNIVGVTILQLYTKGQQIRCLSQIYDLAARLGFVLDARDIPGYSFAGGFVYEPITRYIDNIICLDFSSLYPSIIMAYNICYSTLVPDYEDVPDEDCNIIEFDQEEKIVSNNKRIEFQNDGDEEDDTEDFLEEIKEKKSNSSTKTVIKHYRFRYYKHTKGILPQLVKQLVDERRAVNRQIAQLKQQLKASRNENKSGALEKYLRGDPIKTNVKELEQIVANLSESDPPAPPEVISAAKKELLIAELFSSEFNKKQLQKILSEQPPAHPDLIGLAQYELDISILYSSDDKISISQIHDELVSSREERVNLISSIELLTTVLHMSTIGY